MTQATARQAKLAFNCAWLFDGTADIICFFLPIYVASSMVYFLTCGPFMATFALVMLYGIFPMVGSLHGAATWFHYTDEQNQKYYFGTSKRIFIYGVAPLLITLACALAYVYHLKEWVFWVYMIWTIQHLTQQNVGILLLYHNQGEAIVPRKIEALSQQLSATIFCGLFYLHQYLAGPIFNLIGMICLIALGVLFWHYIWCLLQKAKSGSPVNLPALAFWFVSFWYYLPMLFVGDRYYQGMMLPLFVHWCQYVGLNCVLAARKPTAVKPAKTWMPVARFLAFCAVGTIVFTLMIVFSNIVDGEVQRDVLTGLVMAGSLVHYFQDAYIWRFREPFQRQTILPYLKPERQVAAG